MSDDELKDRVRILARRVVLGEAQMAVESMMGTIEERLEKNNHAGIEIKLMIDVRTLFALARSADMADVLPAIKEEA